MTSPYREPAPHVCSYDTLASDGSHRLRFACDCGKTRPLTAVEAMHEMPDDDAVRNA